MRKHGKIRGKYEKKYANIWEKMGKSCSPLSPSALKPLTRSSKRPVHASASRGERSTRQGMTWQGDTGITSIGSHKKSGDLSHRN